MFLKLHHLVTHFCTLCLINLNCFWYLSDDVLFNLVDPSLALLKADGIFYLIWFMYITLFLVDPSVPLLKADYGITLFFELTVD